MFHFIYKTTNIVNGKFYFGRHSTENIEDGYFGSGVWVRRSKKENLKREIICFCSSEKELLEKECEFLIEWVGASRCMNMNKSSVGFSCGELNPNKREESKPRLRERMIGENNPMWGKKHSEEVLKKISEATKMNNIKRKEEGWIFPDGARQKIRESRLGKKATEETKLKLSESRKGKRPNLGKKHSEETKQRIGQKSKERTRDPRSEETKAKMRRAWELRKLKKC